MSALGQSRLAEELGFYAQRKAEWLAGHPGKYVVIRGTQTVGFYSTFEEAYRTGSGAFGIDADFLVKQIVEHEPVFFVF
jgi:hypothetical protein